jgi:hypothetical protein
VKESVSWMPSAPKWEQQENGGGEDRERLYRVPYLQILLTFITPHPFRMNTKLQIFHILLREDIAVVLILFPRNVFQI